jgi:putative endonuclease
MKNAYVYIMTNYKRTTYYIGVTNNLWRRVSEHVNGRGSKFVGKYKLFDLVYYEHFTDVRYAILREKQLKNWHHDWKVNLIKKMNPELLDLKNELDPETNSG